MAFERPAFAPFHTLLEGLYRGGPFENRAMAQNFLLEERLFAAPTVLDAGLSPFFCPTPAAWTEGQTVNLTLATEESYAFNCELLHRYLPYERGYVYKVGYITAAPGMSGEETRRIHLAYVGGDFANTHYVGFPDHAR